MTLKNRNFILEISALVAWTISSIINFFVNRSFVFKSSSKISVALAEYYERDASVKRKVKAAMAYPMMLMGMTVAIVVLMLGFVIPKFKSTLSTLDVRPEGITKAIYDASDFLSENWYVLATVVMLLGILIFAFFKTRIGKRFIEVFKVKCPLIKKVQINMITARFARAFSLLLSSGMDLASALETTSIIIGNSYIEDKFNEAIEDIRHGVSLTHAFQKQKIFPQMMLQMLSVGERTASLEDVLTRSRVFFDEQVETSLNSLTSKIQPVMLMIMGAVVGTLFIAAYSPMLSIMNSLA